MMTRRPLSLLSAMFCGLALGASVLLTGCGGGGGNDNSGGGGGGGNSPFAGTYQGVYLNTSGPYSPDAGTIAFTVAPNGAVSGSSYDLTGDGSTNSFTGTVSSTGALVTNAVSGPFSQNSTTHVFSASYTESNGTKGVLNVGLAPTASPLAGSYSGTYSSTGGGQGTATITIGSGGAVTGTTIQQGKSGPVSGYVDNAGIAYLANASVGVAQNSIGAFTLAGNSLTGTLTLSGSDGSSSTVTVSLTKQ